jgi:hypothetical protein
MTLVYWSSLPGLVRPVLDDDGRSRSPLRGSPGLDTGFPLATLGARAPTQCAIRYFDCSPLINFEI